MTTRKVIFPPSDFWTRNTSEGHHPAVDLDELQRLDHSALLALLIAATDDLLRLCAVVQSGDADGAEHDAEILDTSWRWGDGNQYSDGTVIAAETIGRHLYAPPHHRKEKN